MESLELPARYDDIDLRVQGGSKEDLDAVLVTYHTFMVANDHLDFDLLSTIWDDSKENLFFNTNGHTYEGLADWENIWNFYRPQFELVSPYLPGRLQVGIEGDLAFVASDKVTRFKRWVGNTSEHNPAAYRSTMVMRRTEDGWQVVHAHFSIEGDGVRPDLAAQGTA